MQLKQSWDDIKERYTTLRDEVASSSREIAESETSLDVIEKNLGKSQYVSDLRTIICAKKMALKSKVQELTDIREKAEAIAASSYESMKELLAIYKDVWKVLQPDDIPSDANETVVKVAKELYPNVKDNHQIRPDPDISGVTKFGRADIVLPDNNTTGSNLDAFFQPLYKQIVIT